MSRKILYIIAFVIVLTGLDGCKGKKMMVSKDKPVKAREGLIKTLSDNELDYESIEIRYSTRAELDDKSYALNITYRNNKNDLLWLSVRAMLGIEVARIIANRDSIWIVSKIGQLKEKGKWEDMSKYLGYPLDFIAFQNIMARKLFYPGQEGYKMLQSFILKGDNDNLILVPDYNKEQQRTDYAKYGFLPQFIVDQKKSKLSGIRLAPEDNQWLFEVRYQEDMGENMGLGNHMLIKAVDPQSNIDLDLKIQQVEINQEFKFPFQWF